MSETPDYGKPHDFEPKVAPKDARTQRLLEQAASERAGRWEAEAHVERLQAEKQSMTDAYTEASRKVERLREERDKEHEAGVEIARKHGAAVAEMERLRDAIRAEADLVLAEDDPGISTVLMAERLLRILEGEK